MEFKKITEEEQVLLCKIEIQMWILKCQTTRMIQTIQKDVILDLQMKPVDVLTINKDIQMINQRVT